MRRTAGVRNLKGSTMNLKSRTVRGTLLALTVAFAVASVPAGGGTADADGPNRAILKAIL